MGLYDADVEKMKNENDCRMIVPAKSSPYYVQFVPGTYQVSRITRERCRVDDGTGARHPNDARTL